MHDGKTAEENSLPSPVDPKDCSGSPTFSGNPTFSDSWSSLLDSDIDISGSELSLDVPVCVAGAGDHEAQEDLSYTESTCDSGRYYAELHPVPILSLGVYYFSCCLC